MITSLSEMCQAKNDSPSSILQIKQELFLLKKKGTLFFTEDLSSLEFEQPFSLYYCIQPAQKGPMNAFPIPKAYYYEYIANADKLFFLKPFFSSYYGEKTFTNELFSLYSNHKLFLSEDFVWFYHDNVDIA